MRTCGPRERAAPKVTGLLHTTLLSCRTGQRLAGKPLESCFLIHKIKVEQIPYCRVVLKKKNEMTPSPLNVCHTASNAALHLPDRAAEVQHGTMTTHCVDSVC